MKNNKIAIITLVGDNYGNKYQNYAAEQLFSIYGEVETYGLERLYQIPRAGKKSLFSKLSPSYIREILTLRPMYKYDINGVDKGIFRNLLYVQLNKKELNTLQKRRKSRFSQFAETYLHISTKILNRENITKEWVDEIDYFVCGSDQIWNPFYATTSELAFCYFSPEKTICLAPSFGVSKIPDYRLNEYRKWLTPIKYLSVRENAGQKIIKDLTGRHAEVLFDPAMALSVDRWRELCRKPEKDLPKRYLVCYFLGKIDKEYRRQIHELAKKMDLSIVMLFDITKPEYYIFDPSEVLYTIQNAEYVLTDSFHGTVFSILFHRDFLVFDRNEGGDSMSSRIDTLLEKVNLMNRHYVKNNNLHVSDKEWKYVDSTIIKEKTRILTYIEKSINFTGWEKE